jgi:putative ABC transport system ATP-binding protein
MLETEVEAHSNCIFRAKGAKKWFDDGQVQALRGIDLCVQEGEFLAIIGPSGCGKTTLLKLLGALHRPSAGTLLYRGRSIADLRDPASYRAREVGFVFQAFHLLPTFTALENVQMPMLESDLSTSERKRKAKDLLELVGLSNRLNHFPAQLSAGERQRVAIARSLANNPSALLADEPTGNLDSENASRILELMVSLQRKREMTLVLITHDLNIAQFADRIIEMKDGRIVSAEEQILAGVR